MNEGHMEDRDIVELKIESEEDAIRFISLAKAGVYKGKDVSFEFAGDRKSVV